MGALVYIGRGAFLPGIPARNLDEAEVKAHGGEKALVASGLYEAPPSKPAKVKEDK